MSSTNTSDKNLADVEEGKDSIAFFYIFFGVALFLPYSLYVVVSNNPAALGGFAYHPPLGAIALSAMAYGISALQPARKPDGVEKALDLHGFFIGLVAVPLVLISGTIMYQRKEDRGQPHYVSWHGIVGITTVLLAFIQAIFGVLLSWGYLPRKLYRYHRQSGYAVFTILVLAFMLGGLYSNFIVRHAWTATRFLAYGLGPLSVWGGVVARIRSRKLW